MLERCSSHQKSRHEQCLDKRLMKTMGQSLDAFDVMDLAQLYHTSMYGGDFVAGCSANVACLRGC